VIILNRAATTAFATMNASGLRCSHLEVEIHKQTERFISLQSVVFAPKDRLWVFDTGSIIFQNTSYEGHAPVSVLSLGIALDAKRFSEE